MGPHGLIIQIRAEFTLGSVIVCQHVIQQRLHLNTCPANYSVYSVCYPFKGSGIMHESIFTMPFAIKDRKIDM